MSTRYKLSWGAVGESLRNFPRESRDRYLQPILMTPRMRDQKSPTVAQAYGQHVLADGILDATWMSCGFLALVRRLCGILAVNVVACAAEAIRSKIANGDFFNIDLNRI